MAKKKNIEVAEEAVQEAVNFQEAEESIKTEIAETSIKMETTPEGKKIFSVKEIPAEVMSYFQNNPEKKAVYFDKSGGMFTESTPKAFLKDAILYQNPNNK